MVPPSLSLFVSISYSTREFGNLKAVWREKIDDLLVNSRQVLQDRGHFLAMKSRLVSHWPWDAKSGQYSRESKQAGAVKKVKKSHNRIYKKSKVKHLVQVKCEVYFE